MERRCSCGYPPTWIRGEPPSDELVDDRESLPCARKHRVCCGRKPGSKLAALPAVFVAGRQSSRRFRRATARRARRGLASGSSSPQSISRRCGTSGPRAPATRCSRICELRPIPCTSGTAIRRAQRSYLSRASTPQRTLPFGSHPELIARSPVYRNRIPPRAAFHCRSGARLVLQGRHELFGAGVEYLAGRRIGVFAVDAEGDPARLIADLESGDLLRAASTVLSKMCIALLCPSLNQSSRSSGVRPMPWLGQP